MSKLASSQPKTKITQPLKNALYALAAVSAIAGALLVAGIWFGVTNANLGANLFALVLVFSSLVCFLIAVRIYAHICLNLAQNDQKHLQNALIQAKDMLDSSKQLRDEQLILQSLLQSLPFPVWLKDRFGRYLITNSAFNSQWANNVTTKGKTDADLLNAKLLQAFAAEDQKAVESGQVQRLELRFDFTGKSAQWVHIERHPLVAEDQQVVGIMGFAFDISAYKRPQS